MSQKWAIINLIRTKNTEIEEQTSIWLIAFKGIARSYHWGSESKFLYPYWVAKKVLLHNRTYRDILADLKPPYLSLDNSK